VQRWDPKIGGFDAAPAASLRLPYDLPSSRQLSVRAFLKSPLYIATLDIKCTKAMTFENLCQVVPSDFNFDGYKFSKVLSTLLDIFSRIFELLFSNQS